MEMRELIEAGYREAGSHTELADALGIPRNMLTDVKGNRKKMPDYACFALAKLLHIDPAIVIAASNLVTEKNEERRKVFYPFVMGKAASFAAIAVLLGTTALPSDSHAMSGNSQHGKNAIYIM